MTENPRTDLPEPVAIDAPPMGGFEIKPFGPQHLDRWREQLDLRLETIARALSAGKLKTKLQIRRVAEKLQVKPDHVKLWLSDPQVLRRASAYAVAEALPYQAEKAKEDLGSFKALQAQAGLVDQSPKIQNNVAIDARTKGDTESDRKFFQQYHKRVESAAVRTDS